MDCLLAFSDVAMSKPSLRIQEGALSARNTPTQPPAETKLVPIGQVLTSPPTNGGSAQVASAPPAPSRTQNLERAPPRATSKHHEAHTSGDERKASKTHSGTPSTPPASTNLVP
jgi:hypothetical protein